MNTKLPGDYIAGFVDGEGCFALKFRKMVRKERKGSPTYYMWGAEFAILLDGKDRELLLSIQNALSVGTITTNKYGNARYSINDMNILNNVIAPFFDKYPLRGNKRHDFQLWKEAIALIQKNKRQKINVEKGKNGFQRTIWDKKDLNRLIEIQIEMKKYKGGAKKEWKWIHKAPRE